MKQLCILLALGLLSCFAFSQEKQATDPVVTVQKKSSNIKGFAMYPNPVQKNSYITITSSKNMHKDILIYDVLGKEILKKQITTNRLNVASLTAGIYIMKVIEDGDTTTRKLVIR